MATHHRTCNLCEANCGILVETDGDDIVSIRGDVDDPLSEGYICPKAHALGDTYRDPDRLTRPLVKRDGEFVETDWADAIATAARGLRDVERRYGNDALASYVGNPSVHNLPAMLGMSAMLRTLGGVRFSASSVDQFPKMLSSYLLFGAQLSVPVPDVDRTDYLLVLGANPVVSNGSLMTAPGMKRRIRRLRERGGKLVVVDPRRSETAALADEHVFIRPGTDPLLLLAMLSTLFDEDRVRLGALADRVDGLDALRAGLAGFEPEAVAAATGIDAETIRRLAREFSDAPTAACYSRIGACVQHYGTLVSYLTDCVNLVAGRLSEPGGAMFPQPAAAYSSRGNYDRFRSRVRGLPEFGGELPVAVMSEEIDTEGEGRLRAMFTCAGNPVLSTPNGRRLDAALEGLEFMVSVDPALNETTRHADVVLPPRHSLKNAQYSVVFHKLAIRDTAKFSLPVFDAADEEWSEWEIFAALCAELTRLRSEDAVAAGGEPVEDTAAGHFALRPEQMIEMLFASGPYERTFDEVRSTPSGIDLGPLKPEAIDGAIRHEDRQVHLRHDVIDGELARLRDDLAAGTIGGEPVDIGATTGNGFLMIGRRQLRSNNSWMHNCPSLMKGPERCTLLMNPADAERLGLKGGRAVRVSSRVGEVEIPLQISDEMMPGVVSMPHGFGHGRDGIRASVASEKPGVSMNDLTDEGVTEGLVGNGILTGVPVRVRASEQPSV